MRKWILRSLQDLNGKLLLVLMAHRTTRCQSSPLLYIRGESSVGVCIFSRKNHQRPTSKRQRTCHRSYTLFSVYPYLFSEYLAVLTIRMPKQEQVDKQVPLDVKEIKRMLLAWVNRQIERHGQHVDNFTSSWQSGYALCALVPFSPYVS